MVILGPRRGIVSYVSGAPFNVLTALLALTPYSLYLAGISSQFQDTAGTTPANANNDPVGRVNDSSPNALNLTRQTADANRPINLVGGGSNGLNAWDFNAGKGFINAAHPSPASAGIVVLVNFDSTDAFAVIASRMNDGSWNDGFGLLIRVNGASVGYENSYSDNNQNADTPISIGQWMVLSVIVLGAAGAGSVTIRKDGVQIDASPSGSAINYLSNNFFVGADGSSNLDGKISAVGMFPAASIPDAEAALMQWAGIG